MATSDYARIEKAIRYLEANFRAQPALAEVAAQVHLSEYHFQRLFRRWAGISPKRFLQVLTAEFARRLLRESRNVLEVSDAFGEYRRGSARKKAMLGWEAAQRAAGDEAMMPEEQP